MDATCPDTFTPFNVSLATRRLVLWLMKQDRERNWSPPSSWPLARHHVFPIVIETSGLEAMTFFKDLRQHNNFENWKSLLYSGEKAMHELCWDHQYTRHLAIEGFIEVIQLRMWSSGNNNNNNKKTLFLWLTGCLNNHSYMWQSCVEIKHYSATYFNCITAVAQYSVFFSGPLGGGNFPP